MFHACDEIRHYRNDKSPPHHINKHCDQNKCQRRFSFHAVRGKTKVNFLRKENIYCTISKAIFPSMVDAMMCCLSITLIVFTMELSILCAQIIFCCNGSMQYTTPFFVPKKTCPSFST